MVNPQDPGRLKSQQPRFERLFPFDGCATSVIIKQTVINKKANTTFKGSITDPANDYLTLQRQEEHLSG